MFYNKYKENQHSITKEDEKQTQTPTGETEKVQVKRLTPTWAGNKLIDERTCSGCCSWWS